VGDVISYQDEKTAEAEEQGQSPGSRIIGFDGKKRAWVITEGVPCVVSTECMRPI
jgi:hypothetical protein